MEGRKHEGYGRREVKEIQEEEKMDEGEEERFT